MPVAAIKSVGNMYMKMMQMHPLPMQAVQSGILMGTGDVVAQTFVDKRSLRETDWRRTSNYFVVGLVMVGPVISRWFSTLEKLFGSNGMKTALKKIALDQGLFAPVFIPVLMSTVALTEGKSIQAIKNKVKNDYKDVLFTNYKIWPFVQVINFTVVPLNYRVIFVMVVALGWNTYLSNKLSS